MSERTVAKRKLEVVSSDDPWPGLWASFERSIDAGGKAKRTRETYRLMSTTGDVASAGWYSGAGNGSSLIGRYGAAAHFRGTGCNTWIHCDCHQYDWRQNNRAHESNTPNGTKHGEPPCDQIVGRQCAEPRLDTMNR